MASGDLRTVTLALATATRFFRLRQAGPTGVTETTPAEGEAGVSVSRETILRFCAYLAAGTQNGNDRPCAPTSARADCSPASNCPANVAAPLFYLEPLPGGGTTNCPLGRRDHHRRRR